MLPPQSHKKFRIRKTLNLLTNADSITIAMKKKKKNNLMGGPNFFFNAVGNDFFCFFIFFGRQHFF